MSDGTPVIEPVDPRKARRVIWVALLGLGVMQAWASRFVATPDGISYVDLSDAVVHGHIADIVNPYWSPLYPLLIGLLRLVFRPGPYWEFGVVHLLNLLLFAASIAAFEYFLRGLTAAADPDGQRRLSSTWGRLGAYGIFGVLSLMMTPLSLPTPDLIVSSATFVAFGAVLRLCVQPGSWRHALVLGVALAAGAYAKSFIIPWSAVLLAATWLATRKSGVRPVAVALLTWVVLVGPWIAVLSAREGKLTFGDTGRLTYIWNVNMLESPSLKVMPHGASTDSSRAALPGAAVFPAARGSNPVWFDPARWYTGLSPTWDTTQQLRVFSQIVSQFVSTFAPIALVIWLAYAVATRQARRAWWPRVAVVVVPAIIAMGAYSLVLVTTRYIAPFMVAIAICTLYLLRWPSRITPFRMLLAVTVPLLIVLTTPGTRVVLSYTNCALISVLVAWSFRRRGPAAMVTAGIGGAVVGLVVQPAQLVSFVVVATVLLVVVYWLASRGALRRGEGREFSRTIRAGLCATNAALILWVAALKYRTSLEADAPVRGEANLTWLQTQVLRKVGFKAGDRVAVIGSPFEAYWSRMAGVQIVGVVPPWSVQPFLTLDAPRRALLLREFARAGASAVIAQSPQSPFPNDSSWVPADYVGWIKRLPH